MQPYASQRNTLSRLTSSLYQLTKRSERINSSSDFARQCGLVSSKGVLFWPRRVLRCLNVSVNKTNYLCIFKGSTNDTRWRPTIRSRSVCLQQYEGAFLPAEVPINSRKSADSA